MLLAIDVGNSNIVVTVFSNDKPKKTIRIDTCACKASGFLSEFKKLKFAGVIVSSVVPSCNSHIARVTKKLFNINPYFVDSSSFLRILQIDLKNRKEIGSDRLVNVFAAKILYGTPLIIIDFGTATTFCAVDHRGHYLGGAIAPGVAISRDALHEKTAKLPRVDISFPKKVIGDDTISAMKSGIFYGYVGIVEGLVVRFRQIIGNNAKVIATGGLSKIIASETDIIDIIDQDLTLKGLNMLWKAIWKN